MAGYPVEYQFLSQLYDLMGENQFHFPNLHTETEVADQAYYVTQSVYWQQANQS